MKKIAFYLPFALFYLLFSCGKITKGTCEDGKKNGKESGVDCGVGVCKACPTCEDGIQNQNETNIDCGGECSPCPTCFDGIKNQNEVGVDCGGVCTICPTCNDGIKNQHEDEIDCGGECQACTTNRCNTALGFGENGYVPSGKASLSAAADTISISSEYEIEVNASFPLFYQCNGYVLSFYDKAFLKLLPSKGMVFTTSEYGYNGSDRSTRCFAEIFMPQSFMTVKPNQKIYITKVNTTTINIKFCNLEAYNVIPYTLNTNFSANINFTL